MVMDMVNNHPWATVTAGWIVIHYAVTLAGNVLRIVYRVIFRLPVILVRGYPPPHCDADGDFKPETSAEAAGEA